NGNALFVSSEVHASSAVVKICVFGTIGRSRPCSVWPPPRNSAPELLPGPQNHAWKVADPRRQSRAVIKIEIEGVAVWEIGNGFGNCITSPAQCGIREIGPGTSDNVRTEFIGDLLDGWTDG